MGYAEDGGRKSLLGSKFAAPAIVLAALLIVAVPAASVVLTTLDSKNDEDHDYDLDWVHGTVTAIIYNDYEEDDDDADDEDEQDDFQGDDEEDEDDDDEIVKLCAFVIDDDIIVKFGPWWYWMYQSPTITDVVHEGDEVNVTGELKELDDGSVVLEAWHIENITTGEELTIKEEGRPPWAGGPKAYGIDPWPPSDEDD